MSSAIFFFCKNRILIYNLPTLEQQRRRQLLSNLINIRQFRFLWVVSARFSPGKRSAICSKSPVIIRDMTNASRTPRLHDNGCIATQRCIISSIQLYNFPTLSWLHNVFFYLNQCVYLLNSIEGNYSQNTCTY